MEEVSGVTHKREVGRDLQVLRLTFRVTADVKYGGP